MLSQIDFSAVVVALAFLAGVVGGVRLAGRSSRQRSWIDEVALPQHPESRK